MRAPVRRPRVKICGHTRVDDVCATVTAGADAVGVITEVAVDTPRAVTVETAASLVEAVPPFVTSVLVTMPENADEASTLVDRVAPAALQVHGHLAPSEFERLVDRVAVPVLRAVDGADADAIRAADGLADALLIDTPDDRGAGGTGRTHDWKRTRRLVESCDSPVILAGGLTPDNVASAVATVRPYGVDVASGVETTGGRKDHAAVRRFVANAIREPEVVDECS